MRGVLKFLLTLVFGLALIWIGFWWYAQARLQAGFTAWAERQASDGGQVSYDALHRGTSIMAAAVTLDNFSMTLPRGLEGGEVLLSLPTLTLRIDALNPLVFHIDLPSKIFLTLAGKFSTVLDLGSSSVTEDLDPDVVFNRKAYPFRASDIRLDNLDILASGSLLLVHFDHLASQTALDLKAGPGQTALRARLACEGLAVSPLFTRLASLPFNGNLARLDLTVALSGPLPPDLPDLLEQANALGDDRQAQAELLEPAVRGWASQGGAAKAGFDMMLGPTAVGASGSLRFDKTQQPYGSADLTADHLDQFTAALAASYPWMQNDIAAAEARLSPDLTNTPQGGQTLALHIVYGGSGIFINGRKTGGMPPIDWRGTPNTPDAGGAGELERMN